MKQYYCLLKKFNNYFNRKVIKYETLSDYQDNSEDFFIPETTEGEMKPFDFNPSDNVTTEIIVNDVPFDPDYFLLLDEEQNIVQRWYVLEQKRNRQGQWQYFLRRDVIVDNLNSLRNAPVFIQKAWLDDGNPLILNDEGMNFNRIKTSETLLKDFSGSAWYVAYLSKNKGGTQINLQIPAGKVEGAVNLSDIANAMSISEAYLISLLNFNNDQVVPSRFVKRVGIHFYTVGQGLIWDQINYISWNSEIDTTQAYAERAYDSDGDSFPLFVQLGTSGGDEAYTNSTILLPAFNNAMAAHKAAFIAQLPTIMNVSYYLDTNKLQILQSYNDKYVYYLGKYYKLKVVLSGTDTKVEDTYFARNKYSSLNDIAVDTAANTAGLYRVLTQDEHVNGYKSILTEADKAYIQLNEISDDPNIPKMDLAISSSRKQTLDQQYDIICFPANDIVFEMDEHDPTDVFTSVGDICRKMIIELGIQEDANVYDIQLLPYCPLSKIFELYDLTEHEDYDLIKDHNDPTKLYGAVFYIPSSSFQQNLNYSLTLKESMKMDNECDLYRIIAPNYQGVFEFNVAKNGGSVDFFTAYCTYKPYTPFIKVTPDFQFVYGIDFNDNRGLLCSGDFSMPRVNSAWESYQLQNKNYQNIFNRDIQNLEIMQGIERRQHAVTGGIGIFTDSVKGAVAGGMVGGGWGAAIGGVLGAGASTVGYLMDKDIMAVQHREQRSLAIDKFNYQLGNIKALPYSLTKIGAFDISSKIFPVLEYYTCTDKEKEAMRLKLKYESMTVMKIGNFGDYYGVFDEPKYFKGELIRCDDIADDNHILEAIYSEIMKGVYM